LTAYLTLGSVYAAQGDQEQARRCYAQASDRAGSQAPARVLQMIRRARDAQAP